MEFKIKLLVTSKSESKQNFTVGFCAEGYGFYKDFDYEDWLKFKVGMEIWATAKVS